MGKMVAREGENMSSNIQNHKSQIKQNLSATWYPHSKMGVADKRTPGWFGAG